MDVPAAEWSCPLRLGLFAALDLVGQYDGLSDILHGRAPLPALTLQGKKSLLFGEFKLAL